MKITVDWNQPVFPAEMLLQIQPRDLDSFYFSASDLDKGNLFFMLLTSLHHYENSENSRAAAHLCYLMAYYLFITLTPPGSCSLAIHYIQKAIALNPCEEYAEWFRLIKKGN